MKEKLLLILLLGIVMTGAAQTETLYSPDGYIKVMVDCSTKQLQYSVQSTHPYIDSLGNAFILPSNIGLELDNGTILGRNPKVTKIERKSVDQEVAAYFYKKAKIQDQYNELIISFKGDFQLIFRAYNSGIAYRFVTNRKESLVIKNEIAEFNFPDNGISNLEPKAFIPYVNRQAAKNGDFSEQLCTSFENTYVDTFLCNMANDRLAFLPMMVNIFYMPRWESNLNNWHTRKAVITEADLYDYPGMYLKHTKGNSMIGYFAPLPKTWEQGGHNNLQYVVKERENYIAKTAGTRNFPWRVIAIATEDKDLANNDLVYLLSEPSKVADIS